MSIIYPSQLRKTRSLSATTHQQEVLIITSSLRKEGRSERDVRVGGGGKMLSGLYWSTKTEVLSQVFNYTIKTDYYVQYILLVTKYFLPTMILLYQFWFFLSLLCSFVTLSSDLGVCARKAVWPCAEWLTSMCVYTFHSRF